MCSRTMLWDARGPNWISISAAVCVAVLLCCPVPAFSEAGSGSSTATQLGGGSMDGSLASRNLHSSQFGRKLEQAGELNVAAQATEPFIKPCSTDPPCPRGGLESWFYCTEGIKMNGCKASRPFRAADCTAQCTRGAEATTVRSYSIPSFSGSANERNRNNPFIVVPEGRLKKICIDSCDGSRSFNELNSLRMNAAANLYLYTPIPGTENTWGYYNIKGNPLPVSQTFSVPRDEFPNICFENPEYGSEAYSRQLEVCERTRRAYPTNYCAKQCYDNSMGLAPGDRIVFGIVLSAIPGDYFTLNNLVVSLHSESVPSGSTVPSGPSGECKDSKLRGEFTDYPSDSLYVQGISLDASPKVKLPEGIARPNTWEFVELTGCERNGVFNVKSFVAFGDSLRWGTCENHVIYGTYIVETVDGKRVEKIEQRRDWFKPYKTVTFANSRSPQTFAGVPQPGDSIQVVASRCPDQEDLSKINVSDWEKI